MAEGMRISIQGAPELMERLAGRQRAVVTHQTRAMNKAIAVVLRRATDNLSGAVLKVGKSGNLRRLQYEVNSDGTRGRIGSNMEYAAIHEYGGVTSPHRIEARRSKALAFASSRFIGPVRLTKSGKLAKRGQTPGSITMVRAVEHPGSVMPARPYLRPALRDSMPEINELFRAGLAAALGKP